MASKLIVSLTLKTTDEGVKAALQTLIDNADKTEKGFKRVSDSTAKSTKAFDLFKGAVQGLGLGAVFSATQLVQSGFALLANSLKANILELDNLADASLKTNIEVGKLAQLKFAAEQSGASLETITTAMRGITNAAENAIKGSAGLVANFKSLGITVADLKSLAPEDLFLRIIEGLSNLNESTETNILTQNLLGGSFLNLKPLLAEGADGIRELMAEQQRLNPVTKEITDAADAAGDAWGRAKESWKGLFNELKSSDISRVGAEIVKALADMGKAALKPIPEVIDEWEALMIQETELAIAAMAKVNKAATTSTPILKAWAAAAFLLGGISTAPLALTPEEVKRQADALKKLHDDQIKLLQDMEEKRRGISIAGLREQERIDLELARSAGLSAEETGRLVVLIQTRTNEEISKLTQDQTEKERKAYEDKAKVIEAIEKDLLAKRKAALELIALIVEDAAKKEQAAREASIKTAETDSRNRLDFLNQEFDQKDRIRALDVELGRLSPAKAEAQAFADLNEELRRTIELKKTELAGVRAAGGETGPIQHELDLLRGRQAGLAEEARLRAIRTGAGPESAFAGIQRGLQDFQAQFGNTFDQFRNVTTDVIGELSSGFSAAIRGAITGTQSLGEAFQNMGLRILDILSDMILKQLVFNAISGFGSFFGGGATAAAATGGGTIPGPTAPIPGGGGGGILSSIQGPASIIPASGLRPQSGVTIVQNLSVNVNRAFDSADVLGIVTHPDSVRAIKSVAIEGISKSMAGIRAVRGVS